MALRPPLAHPQAQYFRSATDEEAFLDKCIFLPEANNLLAAKNSTYKERLMALERFVMFRFTDDATVVPRDSAWFSTLSSTEVVPLREQRLYIEDWLGLRALDEVSPALSRLPALRCLDSYLSI